MSFRCPSCKKATLEITVAVDLGPDGNSDENMLQTVECASCALQALAIYEESRRGSLDSESWHHDGWHVAPAVFARVKKTLLGGTGGRELLAELRAGGDLRDSFHMERA